MSGRAALAGALLLALAAPAQAAPSRESFEQLQALDARVQSAGWRLARGNARFCREVAPAIGLQLQDVANYSDPGAVRDALGLAGDIAVQAVAAGSPSARAGLVANDALSAVAGIEVGALPKAGPGDYARLVGLHDRIDAALRADGRVALARSGQTLTLAGEPVCATRFEMLSDGKRAAADGRRVVIGRKLVETLPEEELLAAALAHELAHNVLGHRARLDASGRSWSQVRTTEREADRLMPWLLVNAGYDPQAALRFFERWGPANDYGIFSSPDHDRPKSRMKRIAAEIATMRAALRADGTADWAREFKPQAD